MAASVRFHTTKTTATYPMAPFRALRWLWLAAVFSTLFPRFSFPMEAVVAILPEGKPAKTATRPARRVGAKSHRGFAAMSPETQRRIASAGGKASHASGRGHRFSAEEAREAGRKGGQVSRRKPAESKARK